MQPAALAAHPVCVELASLNFSLNNCFVRDASAAVTSSDERLTTTVSEPRLRARGMSVFSVLTAGAQPTNRIAKTGIMSTKGLLIISPMTSLKINCLPDLKPKYNENNL